MLPLAVCVLKCLALGFLDMEKECYYLLSCAGSTNLGFGGGAEGVENM